MSNSRFQIIDVVKMQDLMQIPPPTRSLIRPSIRLIVKPESVNTTEQPLLKNEASHFSLSKENNTFPTLPLILGIDCSETAKILPEALLPSEGTLLVYFDLERYLNDYPDVKQCHKMTYVNYNDSLGYKSVDFGYFIEPTLPHYDPFDSLTLQRMGLGVNLTEEEMFAYWKVQENMRRYNGITSTSLHRLFGYPDPLQVDMENACISYFDKRLNQAVNDSKPQCCFLLQIDSDQYLSKSWGDGGRLYFWILQSDLEKQDFSRTWVHLQDS